MTLEKKVTQDKVEIIATGDFKVLQVRTKTAIIEDGVELSSSYHRHVVSPTDDLTSESGEVTAIANTVFTDEMKAAYTASQPVVEEVVEEEVVEEQPVSE